MLDPKQTIAAKSVLICWTTALLLTISSMMLWAIDVQQLANWYSFIPAIALLTSLFAMVTAVYLLSTRSSLTRIVVPTSLASTCWALAIAIGV